MPLSAKSFRQRLKRFSLFFQGNDQVHKTLRRLVRRLERDEIAYAVIGGMACNAHGFQQTTSDVDVLLLHKGLAGFLRLYVPKAYVPVIDGRRRFVDRISEVVVHVHCAGERIGPELPEGITFPDPSKFARRMGGKQVIDLAMLIQLKLAAGRYHDFGDVVGLIQCLTLNESFADQIHPALRNDFLVCLEEKRREESYES